MRRPERSFHIELAPARHGVHPTTARCREREAQGSFVIPFSAEELSRLLPTLGTTLRHLQIEKVDRLLDSQVREAGRRLFQALVSGAVASLYRQTLARAPRASRVAFVLHLDPGAPDFLRLANLPWEILYDPERSCFISLRSPVARSLRVLRRPAEGVPTSLRRVLVVSANPPDRPPLRLPEEAGAIGSGAEACLLENPTLEVLAEHVRSGSYNALHFMGHAEFDPGTGEGALVFCSAAGSSLLVPGGTLADVLADGGFRLVVLNACDTARTCDAEGRDPLLGVAGALVAERLPAAVAMQFPISDAAALEFSRQFYSTLGRGETLGSAVLEGRLAILIRDATSLEWSTPVLYLQEDDAEAIADEPPPSVPSSWREWGTCGLAFALQALAWTSSIWLFTNVPPLFQTGISAVDLLAVTTVLVVFVVALSIGFFRLGSALVQRSRSLAWTVGALAALTGVTLWFSLFS